MKTKELNVLKNEVEPVSRKLSALTEEEFAGVIGGSADIDIAERVIRDDYGNGQKRKDRLRAEGYDYGMVQNAVNKRLDYEKKRHGWLE